MAKKLHVKMFGGFFAGYGEETLTFGRQRDSKFEQLFQILMTKPGQGFSKKDIAENLYGREEVENVNASLNNTIFRLRKYLRESPLPSGEYLILHDGMLRFDSEIEVESDVWSFECEARAFEEAQSRGEEADICRRLCALYQGEFLPHLSNELWVIEKSREYGEIYSKALDCLLRYLKEEGDYRSIESLAGRAAEIYPYGGWESWQIVSLIALGCHKEAEKVYREAAVRVQETGGFLSKDQQIRFHKLGVQIRHPEGAAEDIRRCLMEPEPEEGAYNCTLLGFSDCFRMLKRVIAREGPVCFCLFLCTILDAGGCPAGDREYCEKQGEKLCASFKKYLRRGDIYARYSESQYLLLCIGAEKEDVLEIGMRIDVDFRRRCGGRGGISCRLLDDGSMWTAGPFTGAADRLRRF